eukprot:5034276-Alexandrium_andersonii.AAC.1
MVTPEEAAHAARRALGVELSGQCAQAVDPDLGDYVEMVLLRGPLEARAPMERRLLRDPRIRTESGELRLLPYTGVRPALHRPSEQAEALATALRTTGAPRRRREVECS